MTNESNPINWPLVANVPQIIEINRNHHQMLRYIKAASPDSAALEQVRIAQYAEAVSNAHRAIQRVFDLQERTIELAFVESPLDALDELKNDLDL